MRAAMEQPRVQWECPAQIDDRYMSEPIPVRKGRTIDSKLAHMPADLWQGQLFAGSMTLENPRVHLERGFPNYVTDSEREEGARHGVSIRSVFGHIVPDYPVLLAKGLRGIQADADAQRPFVQNSTEEAFLDSVIVATDAVMNYAARLAERCNPCGWFI